MFSTFHVQTVYSLMLCLILHEMALLLHKTDTVSISMFGVHENFRIRNLQWRALQLCVETELGRGRGE